MKNQKLRPIGNVILSNEEHPTTKQDSYHKHIERLFEKIKQMDKSKQKDPDWNVFRLKRIGEELNHKVSAYKDIDKIVASILKESRYVDLYLLCSAFMEMDSKNYQVKALYGIISRMVFFRVGREEATRMFIEDNGLEWPRSIRQDRYAKMLGSVYDFTKKDYTKEKESAKSKDATINHQLHMEQNFWNISSASIIALMENLIRHMEEELEKHKDELPKGTTGSFSIMKARIMSLFWKFTKLINGNGDYFIKNQCRIAHEEWAEDGTDLMSILESQVCQKYADRMERAMKATSIVAQRSGSVNGRLCAGGVFINASIRKLLNANESIHRRIEKKYKMDLKVDVPFKKDWKQLLDAVEDFDKHIILKKILNDDFTVLARDMIESIMDDIITHDTGYNYFSMVAEYGMTYASFSLCVMIDKMRKGEKLPLSWARSLHERMGHNKEYLRNFAIQARNPDILDRIIDDDPMESAIRMNNRFRKEMNYKITKGENENYDIVMEGADIDTIYRKEYGALLIYRYSVMFDKNIQNDDKHTPKQEEFTKALRELYRSHCQCLSDKTIGTLYKVCNYNQRAILDGLRSIGGMAASTLRRVSKMTRRDFMRCLDLQDDMMYLTNQIAIPGITEIMVMFMMKEEKEGKDKADTLIE